MPPPQFRLGSLMSWMALLCVVFALLKAFGPYAAFWASFLLAAMFAHVAGNVLGAKLRKLGDSPDPEEGEGPPGPRRGASDLRFAPVTRLGERYSLGAPIVIATIAGIGLGAAAGGYALAVMNWERATFASIGLGALACGVLGGIWAFLGSGFVQVTLTALRQATRDVEC